MSLPNSNVLAVIWQLKSTSFLLNNIVCVFGHNLQTRGLMILKLPPLFTLEHVDCCSTLATMAPLATRSPSLLTLRDGLQSRAEEAMEEVNQEAVGAGKGRAATPAPGNTVGLIKNEHSQSYFEDDGVKARSVQIPCTKEADCSRNSSTEAPGDLHTHAVQAPQPHARELCNMPHLQGTLGRGRVEIGWLLLQVITASTVFLSNSGRFNPITTGLPARTSIIAGFPGKEVLADLWIPASHAEWCHQIETTFQNDIFRSGPRTPAGGDAGASTAGPWATQAIDRRHQEDHPMHDCRGERPSSSPSRT